MQIPQATVNAAQNSISFAPPAATELIQQDNQQRSLIAPASAADNTPAQNFGGAKQDSESATYSRQGLVSSDALANDLVARDTKVAKEQEQNDPATQQAASEKAATQQTAAPTKNVAGKELTLEQQQELLHYQQRDQEVRVHEQQHASVGGQHTGTPSYEFKTGPDGKQYVVEGSVSVDVSPVAGDPSATIEKMRQVKAAALAPAQPSSADRKAAARADSHIADATAELMQTKKTQPEESDSEAVVSSAAPSTTDKTLTGVAADKADAKEPKTKTVNNSNPAPAQAATNNKAQLEHRNQVIAGVYGKSAQAQSQHLLSLA